MKTIKGIIIELFIVGFVTTLAVSCNPEEQSDRIIAEDVLEGKIKGLNIDNLLTSDLELVEGTEVVVSYVEVPENFSIPKHHHPGEEFIYILEGSGEVWLKDKSQTPVKKGDVFKVPLNHVHTFTTFDKEAKILVFRVHEKGKPVRILDEEE